MVATHAIYHTHLYHRNYLVSGSRIVRPGAIYRVNVAVPLDSATSLIVRALITKDRQEMASSIEEMVESGTSRNLLMKVRNNLPYYKHSTGK